MHELWHRAAPLARVGLVFAGLALFAVIALVFGLVAMVLWNWIMPDVFGLRPLTYWQAWGLVLLAHILFKSPGGRRHGPPGRRRLHERYDRPPGAEAPAANA